MPTPKQQERVREALRKHGTRRARAAAAAERAERSLIAELDRLVERGRDAGLQMTEMAKLAGVARATVTRAGTRNRRNGR